RAAMKRALALMVLLVACAGSQQEAKSPAEKGAAPAAAAQPPMAAPAAAAEPSTGPDAGVSAQITAGGALLPGGALRAPPPPPLPQQPRCDAPVPVERKLKNGARVLIVENHALPLVAVELRFLHGVDADPRQKPGLAEFVADTVDEGTKTRSAERLAEEVEDLAAHLGAGASLETASVHLNCLTETLPKALELMADMVQNPAFRSEDVERVRLLKLTALEQKKANTGALAADRAARILYGKDHPWGQPSGGTPESVASITSKDLAAFHARYWVPNDAVISVSGDVKAAEIVRLLEEKFASWKAKALPKASLPPLPQLSQREIVALEKPGTTQAQVWVIGR